jgi:hypothetical protein
MDRYHVDAQDWYPDSMCGQFVLFDDALKAIATARAEALREAAERIRVKYATGIYGTSVEGIIKTILADKQEEK